MERFDYAVVGAGSAGAVVASRLSEDVESTVLLLEAGPDHTSGETPAGIAAPNFFGAMEVPGRLWPELQAQRADGQTASIYVRGRGVGGSSAINAMMALRGVPEDYDRWASELGCAGWAWRDMCAAFVAIEDDVDFGGDGLHGRGGPIPLTRPAPSDLAPLDVALRAALADLAYPTCDDYHAPNATGVSFAALTMRDGRRVSTNDAYLEPARRRPNLLIRGDVVVDRVVLDGRRAVGLRTAHGEQIEADEVIVCAGAIHSPAVLLRSGIGPEIGIPVGANLMDHAATAGFELDLSEGGRMRATDVPVLQSVVRYSSELAGTGPNDMQMVWFGGAGNTVEALHTGRLIGAVMQVFSRGEVRLRSDDPLDDPVVAFHMLSDGRDALRARDVVRRMIELIRHPAVAAVTDAVLAGPEPVDALSSDDAIDEWLSRYIGDYVHAAGTCRMGRPDDPRAVVDPACRVRGFERLRVCDASVMPDIPRANTHLTTVAIAERVATMMTNEK